MCALKTFSLTRMFVAQLLYCRGTMVDTITQCGVARYLEFKAVSKLFTFSGDRLLQVCSIRLLCLLLALLDYILHSTI